MNKHTPAPWKIENRGGWPVITENHGDIAYMKDRLSMQANAQLIAAAPELLSALEALFENCVMIHKYGGSADNTKEADKAINAARAAIQNATR